MTNQTPEREQNLSTYSLGYQAHTQALTMRTAQSSAAFLLPYLSPGMTLLDCGCGPGTITLDLAEVVTPGAVTGIDFEAVQVQRAASAAQDRNCSNVTFQLGDVYCLEFSDSSFDAVFAHALLMHLSDPLKALKEMNRVLKPGGMIGLREIDRDSNIFIPQDSILEQAMLNLFPKVIELNGGSPYVGRQLRPLLRESGFQHVQLSASFQCFSTQESLKRISEAWAGRCEEPDFVEKVTEFGLADRATLAEIARSFRTMGDSPDGFRANAYCEAVGWKE